MPIERSREPWPGPGPTYNGFASTAPKSQAPPPPRVLRRGAPLAAVGALAVGLLLGLWARSGLDIVRSPAVTSAGALLAASSWAQVPIEFTPPPPEAPRTELQSRPQEAPPRIAVARRPAPPAARTPLHAAARNAGLPPWRASFDCAVAQPGAERAVCADPALAAADLRLARAYRRARDAGVDPGRLDREQREWKSVREDAARRSGDALADAYADRIAEVNAMADEPPH
jgi:uncharacterized protein YecT (DUF1311 family)